MNIYEREDEENYIQKSTHTYIQKITHEYLEGRRETSCTAKPCWMAKSILVNTTFIDLRHIILLSMAL